MQRILIIGKVWPEPASSAAGSRTLQLIELFLLQGWSVSFASAAGESEYTSDIESLGVNKHTIELNNSSFDAFIKTLQPTLVIFDRFTMEEQFGWRVADACPEAIRVLDTIDLHCLRAARHSALKEKREFVMSDLVSDIAKRELASIYRSDVSLMISEVEMELLQQFFKVDASLLHYVPFLLDPLTNVQCQSWSQFSEREHFISIGNFLHEPNWDAVLYLKQEIWPLIRKQLPKSELHVYGAYPSHKVFQLHNPKEGFMIKGRAESAEDVMKKARICLAPLRFGAGIKGKLIDAMQYGTPGITTDIGAESMHGELAWNGAIANTPQKIAEAAIQFYTNENLWKQAQQNGINIIDQFFSKEKHGKALIEKLLTTQAHLKQHRVNNFTGAMLMHHTAASTKYMSLWIEAKNKLF
jgi:glycosyltransferase involved in cell wall biosynthesis